MKCQERTTELSPTKAFGLKALLWTLGLSLSKFQTWRLDSGHLYVVHLYEIISTKNGVSNYGNLLLLKGFLLIHKKYRNVLSCLMNSKQIRWGHNIIVCFKIIHSTTTVLTVSETFTLTINPRLEDWSNLLVVGSGVLLLFWNWFFPFFLKWQGKEPTGRIFQ